MCVCGASSIAHALRRREGVGRGAQDVPRQERIRSEACRAYYIQGTIYIATSELASIKARLVGPKAGVSP